MKIDSPRDLTISVDTSRPLKNNDIEVAYWAEMIRDHSNTSDLRRLLYYTNSQGNRIYELNFDTLNIMIDNQKIQFSDTANKFLESYFRDKEKYANPKKYYDCAWFAAGIVGLIPQSYNPEIPINIQISSWNRNTTLNEIVSQESSNQNGWTPNLISFYNNNQSTFIHHGTVVTMNNRPLILSKYGNNGDVTVASFTQVSNQFPFHDFLIFTPKT